MKVPENYKAKIIMADGAIQLLAKASGLIHRAILDDEITVPEAIGFVQAMGGAFLESRS